MTSTCARSSAGRDPANSPVQEPPGDGWRCRTLLHVARLILLTHVISELKRDFHTHFIDEKTEARSSQPIGARAEEEETDPWRRGRGEGEVREGPRRGRVSP